MSAQPAVNHDAFAEARESFGAMETYLGSKEACSLRESDLERELLVPRFSHARWNDGHAIVGGHFLVRGIQVGFIAAGTENSRL